MSEANLSQAIDEQRQNTVAQNPEQNTTAASSPAPSAESNEKASVKALLAEARNTRDMLMHFVSAVETGTYSGGQMMNVAKGMAFLDAILRQNNAHIQRLQDSLK